MNPAQALFFSLNSLSDLVHIALFYSVVNFIFSPCLILSKSLMGTPGHRFLIIYSIYPFSFQMVCNGKPMSPMSTYAYFVILHTVIFFPSLVSRSFKYVIPSKSKYAFIHAANCCLSISPSQLNACSASSRLNLFGKSYW